MKKGIMIAALLLTASTASALVSFHLDVSYQGDLSCHGRWVSTADLGHVWVPRVHITWSPYTYGHWAWSSWGWMWISHEPWYATYHYGRWLWTDYHGWVWVPGRIWAPAWVVWSHGPGWVGWTPMPPDWCDGYWSRPAYHRHHGRWVVVNDHGFLSGTVWKEKLPDHRVKSIVDDSFNDFDAKYKGGIRFAGAPKRDDVEKTTGKRAEYVERERAKTYERDRVAGEEEKHPREKAAGDSDLRGKPLEPSRERESENRSREVPDRDSRRESVREREPADEQRREIRSVPKQRKANSEAEEGATERPSEPRRDHPSSPYRERSYQGPTDRSPVQERSRGGRAPSSDPRSYQGTRSRPEQGRSRSNMAESHGSASSHGGDRSRGGSGERRK